MDRYLREAERSGDGVALLKAKLRVGELTKAHVELAASLGHTAALELFPDVDAVDWDALAAAPNNLRNFVFSFLAQTAGWE